MPGRNLYVATPAGVSCAVAIKPEPSQRVAPALQNFTCPGCTGVVPETTVAVSVTTVPAATEVTSEPALVTVSDVVVGAAVAHACDELDMVIRASVAGRMKARTVD